LSPDGSRVLLSRNVASSSGRSERRFTLLPFAGGTEVPLNTAAGTGSSRWTDSVTVLLAGQTPGGMRASLVDVRTGTTVRSVDLPDSLVRDIVSLPDGWAWVPSTSGRIAIRHGDRTIEVAKPAWFASLYGIDVDP